MANTIAHLMDRKTQYRHRSLWFAYLALLAPLLAAEPAVQVRALSAEESRQTIQLPPGYRLELALGDVEIRDPVVAAFDGNGGLYVAEFRSYMLDADGTGQQSATSRVSYHRSTKGDGVFDRHSIFADALVLPRLILPLGRGQLLIGESYTLDIHLYTDVDGDGVSDQRELWYAGGPTPAISEHQPSGLVWCQDNWIYTTVNTHRLRWTPLGSVKEPIPPNEGQWGLAQDDYGKPWPMNGRGERGPVQFQVPMQYGNIRVTGEVAPGFAEVWPLVGLADVQPGVGRFRPSDKTLNHFTANAGVIYARSSIDMAWGK